jgi:hypothetical protein
VEGVSSSQGYGAWLVGTHKIGQKHACDFSASALDKISRHCRQLLLGSSVIIKRDWARTLGRIEAQNVIPSNEQVSLAKRIEGLCPHCGLNVVPPMQEDDL